jgi:hypothetical protein
VTARGLAAIPPRTADVVLTLRMLAWSLALPALKHVVALPRLAQLMRTRPRRGVQRERMAVVVFIAQRIYRLRPFLRRDNCLERSLLTYRYLSLAGLDPRLVIGIDATDARRRGHAWIVVQGEPLYDSHESLERFVKLAEFPES